MDKVRTLEEKVVFQRKALVEIDQVLINLKSSLKGNLYLYRNDHSLCSHIYSSVDKLFLHLSSYPTTHQSIHASF